MKLTAISLLVSSTAAFPALLNLKGNEKLLDTSVLDLNKHKAVKNIYPAADPKNCPFNPDHVPAAPWNASFPYNHAKNGLPGKGKGGYQVPAPGDEEHRFIHPTATDIRGP